MKRKHFVIVFLFSCLSGFSMTKPQLIKDIRPGGSSLPREFVRIGSLVFFAANDSVHGNELWVTDNTPDGTVLLKDIYPGTSSSGPTNLTVMGSTLFFAASNGFHGMELWRSDGTPEGTVMLRDINLSGGSSPQYLTVIGSTLYFSANDGVNGIELWKTDGTPGGTVMVEDIRSGAMGSNPRYLKAYNSKLYFQAEDGINGVELWQSNGDTASTVLLKDINPGATSSNPNYFIVMGGMLYFSATDGGTNYELWKTDGTSGNTVNVKEIWSGIKGSNPMYFAATSNTLYFSANDSVNGRQLWKSDGTAGNTSMVTSIFPNGTKVTNVTAVNSGIVFFMADDDNTPTYSPVLWRTDGTTGGTFSINAVYYDPFVETSLPVLGNKMFFYGQNPLDSPSLDIGLWQCDTGAGSASLIEEMSILSTSMRMINSTLYLGASSYLTGNTGYELWIMSGTPIINTTADKDSICKGDSVHFTHTNQYGVSYEWSVNDSIVSTDSNTTIVFPDSGIYKILFRAYNIENGSNTWDTVVNVLHGPVVNLGEDQTICKDSSILLYAGASAAQYSWSTGTNDSTYLFTASDTGNYAVSVTGIDGFGCNNTDSILLMAELCLDTTGWGDTSGGDTTSILTILQAQDIVIHPNPFNEESYINYTIVYTAEVIIDIYNILGQHIFNLYEGRQQNGSHTIAFNPGLKGIQEEMYLVKIKVNENSYTKHLLQLR